ncbi:hypothetical protein COR50_06935 [Chitinophaga caeni]|uniref:Uncharacterized protein n=1 Tax=Chitinophaga caeni TaxID=2029983 RepID=A0A291QSI6_9BACT|nr:hypothetical protein COR50_06935 [Chitinophaga caeni]
MSRERHLAFYIYYGIDYSGIWPRAAPSILFPINRQNQTIKEMMQNFAIHLCMFPHTTAQKRAISQRFYFG